MSPGGPAAMAAPDPFARKQPVLIMGNGPSAKLIDFDRLRDGRIATVGMNAAYRHWDRIDFRPTYYVCMDSVLIRSHAGRIAEMIREGRIERFFLRDEFREMHPEFADHERVLWFETERQQKGSLFDTNMVTTGSWAIRWMAQTGRHLIAAIGIDANYVEILAEAARLGSDRDLRLELKRTPGFNPNYFFNDYQQAGDRYNIPNDPDYAKKTGQLVHVDALRRARDDMARLGFDARVFDCSPLSGHGVFPKLPFDRLYDMTSLAVVTSFFLAAPVDELENNLRIAALNAGQAGISKVLVLFEGDPAGLEDRVDARVARQVRQLEAGGKLAFRRIDRRPSYGELFAAARALGRGVAAVANADILFDAAFLDGFLPRFLLASAPMAALTRWNQTPNGRFLQGGAASPPWAQVPVEAMRPEDRNYLSFDAYVFDARCPLPERLDEVLIGTFGCDTAVAALFRAAGVAVVNPCLAHQVVHLDDKLRSYASEAGERQMRTNHAAVREALMARVGRGSLIGRSLERAEELREAAVSLGTPHPLGPWQSLFRMLGAVPWSDRVEARPARFERFVLDARQAGREAEDWARRIGAALDAEAFVEIEISGDADPPRYLGAFTRHPVLATLRDRLYRHNWQSVVNVDAATDAERTVHADLLLLARAVLTLGTPALLPALAAEEIVVPGGAAGERKAGAQKAPAAAPAVTGRPKLLIIDSTPVGHGSATGQVKQAFLGEWPASQLLQVWQHGGTQGPLQLFRPGAQAVPDGAAEVSSDEQLLRRCAEFAPEVIYCRPVDSEPLLRFAETVAVRLARPLVVHMMDDWPERLRAESPAVFPAIDHLLRRLLARARVRLSIGEAMAAAYAGRYGGDWRPLANGVDVAHIPAKDWAARGAVGAARPFVVRYMGGFADDMGAASVTDIARVVASMQSTHPIRFEIRTMPWYRQKAEEAVRGMAGVSVADLVPAADYARALSEADALVIAYNFDERSRAYTGLSVANKLPECLASGAAVLGYGPEDAATLQQLRRAGCAALVLQRDDGALREALARLAEDPAQAARLGIAGRAWAGAHLGLSRVRADFLAAVRSAAAPLPAGAALPVVQRPLVLCGLPPGRVRAETIELCGGAERLTEGRFRLPAVVQQAGGGVQARFELKASALGRNFVVWLSLQASHPGALRWRVSAPGSEIPWQTVDLPAGRPVSLGLHQRVEQGGRVLLVELAWPSIPGLDLAIDTWCLADVPLTARPEDVTLHGANAMARAGRLLEAAQAYASLHARRRIEAYADNAIRCIRELAAPAVAQAGTPAPTTATA